MRPSRGTALTPTALQLSIIYVSLSAFCRYLEQDEHLNCLLRAVNGRSPPPSCNHFVACKIVVCYISAHQMKFIDELHDSPNNFRWKTWKKGNAQSCASSSATLAIAASTYYFAATDCLLLSSRQRCFWFSIQIGLLGSMCAACR